MLTRKPYLFSTPRKKDGSLHKPGVRGIHETINTVRKMGSMNSKGDAARIRSMRNKMGRKKAKIALYKTAARNLRAGC